jgi:hypothetical protein
MSQRRLARLATVFGTTTAVLVTMVTGASAHYVYQNGFTWANSNSSRCTWEYGESSHGQTGHGYMKGYVQGWQSYFNGSTIYNCAQAKSAGYNSHWYLPTHNLRQTDFYFKYKGSGNGWSLCELTGHWVYNAKPSYGLTVAGEMKGDLACGSGYYGTLAYGQAYYNGNWQGGTKFSGGHFLPQPPKANLDATTVTSSYHAALDYALSDDGSDSDVGVSSVDDPAIGVVNVAGPDGNDLVNPSTGQPFTVDLNNLLDDSSSDPVSAASETGWNDATSIIANLTTSSVEVPDAEDVGEEYYVDTPIVASAAILGNFVPRTVPKP